MYNYKIKTNDYRSLNDQLNMSSTKDPIEEGWVWACIENNEDLNL